MEKKNTFLDTILAFFATRQDLVQAVLALPLCKSGCICSKLSNCLKNFDLHRTHQDFFKMIDVAYPVGPLMFYKIFNVLMVECHEHTVNHCKLACPKYCPFHSFFYISYQVSSSCACNSKVSYNIESFEFKLNLLEDTPTPNIKEINNAKWGGYLTKFIGNALMYNAMSVACTTAACEKYLNQEFQVDIIGEFLIFNIVQKEYQNMWHTLRTFALFKFCLPSEDLLQNNLAYTLAGYFIVNSTNSGYFYQIDSAWVLVFNQTSFQGNYSELLEKLLSENFFIVSVVYSRSQILNQLPQNFGQIQKSLSKYLHLQYRNLSFPNLGPFEFFQKVRNPSEIKKKNSKILFEFRSSVKKEQICERCKKKCLIGEVCCLRCDGEIIDNICEVCGFRLDGAKCEVCLEKYWRCAVCYYPNIEEFVCIRCNNPNEELCEMEFIASALFVDFSCSV